MLQHPDGSTLAAGANAADAELYLDLALDDERCHGAYYAATGFESAGGKRLADHARRAGAPRARTTTGSVGRHAPRCPP